MGMVHGPNVVTDGLVFLMDAGNVQSYPGSGSTWYDIVGTSDGTITGATYSSNNGGYFTFDGNDTVATGSSIITGNNFWSCSLWIYPTANGTPLLMGNTATSQAMLLFWDDSGDTIRLGIWGADKLTATTSCPKDAWSHVGWTWDGTTTKAYINGSAAGTATGFSFNIASTRTDIGSAGPYQFFNGRIPNVGIYNRALSAAEALQNYNAHKSRFGL
jgi:hypothetical protein